MGAKYNIKGFPTVLLFGSRKEQPNQFNGQRNVDGVINYVFDQMRSLVEKRKNPSGKGSAKDSGNSGAGHGSSGSHPPPPPPTQDDSDVVVLTDSNFESTIKAANSLWFIEFYGTIWLIILC